MEKISKHVSWHEGTYSRTGERRGLDNTPNEDQLKCMKEVAPGKASDPYRCHPSGYLILVLIQHQVVLRVYIPDIL